MPTEEPFLTKVRGNASYTIPWIDVLAGAVFQYRPGPERTANLNYNSTDVVWEPGDANRPARSSTPPRDVWDVSGRNQRQYREPAGQP